METSDVRKWMERKAIAPKTGTFARRKSWLGLRKNHRLHRQTPLVFIAMDPNLPRYYKQYKGRSPSFLGSVIAVLNGAISRWTERTGGQCRTPHQLYLPLHSILHAIAVAVKFESFEVTAKAREFA